MKVYIVIAVLGRKTPKIVGVYTDKSKAEEVAYSNTDAWCNVIEKEVIKL